MRPQTTSIHMSDGNLILAVEQSDSGVEINVRDIALKLPVTKIIWEGSLYDLAEILEDWAERNRPDPGPQAPAHVLVPVGHDYTGRER